MNKINKIIFFSLCFAFCIYTATIYQLEAVPEENKTNYNLVLADQGKLLWQQNNCSTCHQIYGLGGYLGPDLTNIYSTPAGLPYLKGIIRSGTRQMPGFAFSEQEMDAMIEYLKSLDRSGIADPRNFTIHSNGNISPR